MHLSKKNREGGGEKKTKQNPTPQSPANPSVGAFQGSLAALAILAGGNDLTWRSPRPPPARGLGPWGGEWGPGADLLFPAALGRWPPARPSPPHAAGLGCSSFGRLRGRAELGFCSLPCVEQGNEGFGGARVIPGVKPSPLGIQQEMGRGGQEWRSGADMPQGELPPALQPWCAHPCYFILLIFRSGFIKWMLQLAAAPPRSLRCRTAASRAGQVPAPGRWRGAIRRASFDSLSQLPLFNQIIGKVNLLDSCSLQPPPFPCSPRPHALPTRGSVCPLHPDAVLRCHARRSAVNFLF